MPEDEGIAATLAGALLQVRAIRGTAPDEKEAVRTYIAVLKGVAHPIVGGAGTIVTQHPYPSRFAGGYVVWFDGQSGLKVGMPWDTVLHGIR